MLLASRCAWGSGGGVGRRAASRDDGIEFQRLFAHRVIVVEFVDAARPTREEGAVLVVRHSAVATVRAMIGFWCDVSSALD